jgi:PHP family Zn ribbon phosphoesterase
MDLTVDLHAHSVFAGGTQALKLTLEKSNVNRKKAIDHLKNTNKTMPLKGIDLVGTGDCQFSTWTNILEDALVEDVPGVYYLEDNYHTRFILQTEIIFTLPVQKRKKIAHVVFLFPSFSSVRSFTDLLDNWGVKRKKMARPFVKCDSSFQVAKRIHQILDLDPFIEAIPAHIMTPQGVFGSNVRITKLNEFFDDATNRIHAVETGLSADPQFLGLIPELDNKTLISSSDAHSSALHRMGREFTVLSLAKISFSNIIDALRENKVLFTAEFPPEEGRFFLTGHRGGRKAPGVHKEDEHCYFSPQNVPKNDVCPICHKKLTVGVYQRCVEISREQGADRILSEIVPRQEFIRVVPLIDILSNSMEVKTKTAKSLVNKYRDIVTLTGPESKLWTLSVKEIEHRLSDKIEEKIKAALIHIKEGDFTFYPYGFDGEYGTLQIGKTGNFSDISVIKSNKPRQQQLF